MEKDWVAATRQAHLAKAAGTRIVESDDREQFAKDLASLPRRLLVIPNAGRGRKA